MPIARGTGLVTTVARVVQLTGVQDLANLEADSELTLTDLLLVAHQELYDRIEAEGTDPTLVTNPEVYHSAQAYLFVAKVAMNGSLNVAGETTAETVARYMSAYEQAYARVRPKSTADDVARAANEGVPAVGNFYPGWVFSGGRDGRTDQYRNWLPTGRR